MRHIERGFTLVELAIVLVLLGLLVGGVMAGQNLIRAAELKSVSREFEKYQMAVLVFKDEYLGLPGDLTNATQYWGADPDGCPTHTNLVSKQETCNGDGNGLIGNAQNSTDPANHEWPRAWQQLANAGLIEGLYTGVISNSGDLWSMTHGENIPNSKVSNAAWWLIDYGNPSGAQTCCFGTHYGNTFLLRGGVLNGEEMWNIDKKMDDGHPVHGIVKAYKTAPGCVTTTVISTTAYTLDDDSGQCQIMFKGDF